MKHVALFLFIATRFRSPLWRRSFEATETMGLGTKHYQYSHSIIFAVLLSFRDVVKYLHLNNRKFLLCFIAFRQVCVAQSV